MINIAVLVYDLLNSYNITVIHGISKFFADKNDVRLIIAPVMLPHSTKSENDYQFWTSAKLLEAKEIDGLIIIPNSFTNNIKKDELEKELQIFYGKPCISIAVPLNIPDCKTVSNSCQKAYCQVVKHLKEKHNCTKFAFFTADLLQDAESKTRFQNFKQALKENNLEFDEKLVFDGDYTPGTAQKVLAEKYKSKDEINFDALLCVNDFTAGGALLHLQNTLGCQIPEEIKIFGFDDSDFSLITYPTISTISQTISQHGYKASEVLYKTLKGEETEKNTIIDSFPIYRQSCGCISSKTHNSSYYDENGIFYEIDKNRQQKELDTISQHDYILETIYKFLNIMDSRTSLENFITLIKPYLKNARISALMFCTYGKPVILNPEDDFTVPETAQVQAAINVEDNTQTSFAIDSGFTFNLKENIAPARYKRILCGNYFLYPICVHNKNYGFILCKSSTDDYVLMSINLKVLSDIFINSYEFSAEKKERELLLLDKENLSIRAQTDELTQIYNRRGILNYGQKLIDLNVSMGKTGLVFFCDLDGLKKINDTYGHKTGDSAIQTQAKVLKNLFRSSDLTGRLSGDEFCVITPELPLGKVSQIKEKMKVLNKDFSEKAGLPFTLSISMGAVEFNSKNNDLPLLLQQADKKLYEEKQIKHGMKK